MSSELAEGLRRAFPKHLVRDLLLLGLQVCGNGLLAIADVRRNVLLLGAEIGGYLLQIEVGAVRCRSSAACNINMIRAIVVVAECIASSIAAAAAGSPASSSMLVSPAHHPGAVPAPLRMRATLIRLSSYTDSPSECLSECFVDQGRRVCCKC